MNRFKNTAKGIYVSEIAFDQLTQLIRDIKHCNELLFQAIDSSLMQCQKIKIEKTEEEFEE